MQTRGPPAAITCLFVAVESTYVWIVDHAVVVGAGVGGLAASLVLSRVAARVTLVERAERPSEVGAALGSTAVVPVANLRVF